MHFKQYIKTKILCFGIKLYNLTPSNGMKLNFLVNSNILNRPHQWFPKSFMYLVLLNKLSRTVASEKLNCLRNIFLSYLEMFEDYVRKS